MKPTCLPRVVGLPAVTLGIALTMLVSPAGAKPKITKQDDLPRHAYPVSGQAVDLLEQPELFAPFAARVRADIESDLESYEIEDKSTLKKLHSVLLALDLVDGRHADAEKRITLLRELEDKPADKLVMGLSARAWIRAANTADRKTDPAAFRAAYAQHYAASLEALPWDVVQDLLQGQKGQMETVSKNLILGIVGEQVQPVITKTGEVSGTIAQQLVSFYQLIHQTLTVKEETLAALREIIDRNTEEKEDIWAARAVDLDGTANLTPVLIAIWDAGVDTEVFADRLFTNTGETLDGTDTDGNGFVDDVHGIAYDLEWRPIPELLYPMDEATRPTADLQAELKGLFDMQAALDSPQASTLKKKLSGLEQTQVKPFLEDLNRYAFHSHGTHVGGIATAGNPASRLLVSRLTADPKLIPTAPTIERSRRAARAFQANVDYFRAHGVRVVNMSWVIARSEFETSLEKNGIGADAEERRKLARTMFDLEKKALLAAFKSAPDILFVGGAGNSNNDIAFDEFIPPMFDLPNLLICGAVDQAGDPTFFTSFGPTVNAYASGFEVESFVPGGDRMKLSGTSMASPGVANLAAKLIAIEPALTPEQTVALILDGADERREGDQLMRIINPRRSVELLKERQAKASM